MNIVIVEDETVVALRLIKLIKKALPEQTVSIEHFETIDSAEDYIDEHSIDLLFLDLNLNGQDGFSILKNYLTKSFQTIIVSANTDRAIDAFEYGVLDFIGKPFNLSRLQKALGYFANKNDHKQCMYLSVKKYGRIELLETQNIEYIKTEGNYSQLNLKDDIKELHDKSLEQLLLILPNHFQRVHKSYIVNMHCLAELKKYPGTRYELILNNGIIVPLGRTHYSKIRDLIQQ
jgi:two-component system response regulator LytT